MNHVNIIFVHYKTQQWTNQCTAQCCNLNRKDLFYSGFVKLFMTIRLYGSRQHVGTVILIGNIFCTANTFYYAANCGVHDSIQKYLSLSFCQYDYGAKNWKHDFLRRCNFDSKCIWFSFAKLECSKLCLSVSSRDVKYVLSIYLWCRLSEMMVFGLHHVNGQLLCVSRLTMLLVQEK